MKFILVSILALSFVGCGQVSRVGAAWTGHSTVCVDGVNYVQFTSGATVKYNRDGSINTCN